VTYVTVKGKLCHGSKRRWRVTSDTLGQDSGMWNWRAWARYRWEVLFQEYGRRVIQSSSGGIWRIDRDSRHAIP